LKSHAVSAVTHWGFVLTGIVTTMLGPLLPALAARWALSDERAGYLFAAQFLGALGSTLGSGFLYARAGFLETMSAGFVCMAVGVALLGGPWWMGLSAAAVWGVGIGLVVPASNLLMAAMTAKHGAAAALNWLNMFWGAGAVSAPLLIAMVLHAGRLATFLLGFAAILVGTALTAWLFRRKTEGSPPFHEAASAGATLVPPVGSIAALTAALLFLYVGVESGIAGWMPSFTMRAFRLGESERAVAQSVFWGALLMGRLVAPILLKRLSGSGLIVMGSTLSFAALVTVLLTSRLAFVLAGAGLAGAGLAAIYPTAIAIYSTRYAVSPPPNAGFVFAAGALGGAILPWLVGTISTGFQDLRAGMLLPLACLALMTAVQLRIRHRIRASP